MAKTDASPLGSLSKDDNMTAVQTGNSFTTTDVTGTPVTSPASYTNATTTITIPDGAVEMIIMPTTDLRISELSNVAAYDLIKANTKESIPVARMSTLYITRDASSGSAYFRFVIV
jgi:hypothetical protein